MLLSISVVIATFLAYALTAIIGIDYGQQYAKAVLLGQDHPFELILTDDSKRKDLSAVAIRDVAGSSNDVDRHYGSRASSVCARFPGSCASDLKSLLGVSAFSHEAESYVSDHFGVSIHPDPERGDSVILDLGLKNKLLTFTPEELVAMHLFQIKQRAIKDLSLHASLLRAILAEDVAVAVAPFATPEQRQAMLDALALVPFSNVMGLVDDGTSVALNYLLNRRLDPKPLISNEKEYYMVFDMGAGSTTATIFSYYYNGSRVLEMELMAFDASLGGQYFTRQIYTLITEKLARHFKIKERKIPNRARARLWAAAELAKITLSVNQEFSSSLELIYNDKDFRIHVSREEFEEFSSDVMERITAPVTKALAQANIDLDLLRLVIVTGGLTRVPFVKKHLSTLVGEPKISRLVNADELCALGTTLRALQWKTQLSEFLLIDKVYHTFSAALGSQEPISVFPKLLPSGSSARISLGAPNQDIDLNLYMDGRLIKTYEVKDVLTKSLKLNCTKGKVDFVATFKIDENKMFDVSKVEVECVPEPLSFVGEWFKKAEAKKESKTATNSTDGAPSGKQATAVIPLPKAIYPGVKPFTRTVKNRLAAKLVSLNARDEAQIALEHARNVLEARCYAMRELIDDHEECLERHLPKEDLEANLEFLLGVLAWTDFGSDNAELSEFDVKTEELEQRMHQIRTAIEMDRVDLSQRAIKSVVDGAKTVAQQVEAKLADFEEEMDSVRQKYAAAGVDFEHMRDKVVARLVQLATNFTSFTELVHDFEDQLKSAQDLVALEEEKFSAVQPSKVYEQYKSFTNVLTPLVTQLPQVEKDQERRFKLLEERLEMLVLKQKQKELREREKKERAEAPKEDEKDGEDKIEDDNDEQFQFEDLEEEDQADGADAESQSPVANETDTSQTNEKATKSAAHDEL